MAKLKLMFVTQISKYYNVCRNLSSTDKDVSEESCPWIPDGKRCANTKHGNDRDINYFFKIAKFSRTLLDEFELKM